MTLKGLWAELAAQITGEIRTDDLSRAIYATDASIYQIAPLGVVAPRTDADVAATLAVARRHGVSITSRGGATSLAGQTVGAGLQLDFSRFMHAIRWIDPEARLMHVEPGVTLSEVNRAAAAHGLMFAPDVSPANRATIGGMIGNNSCGMYSLVYGKTIDHIAAIDALLADGTTIRAEPQTSPANATRGFMGQQEAALYAGLRGIITDHRDAIEVGFPKILRRVGGYNLDRLAARPDALNLVDLLVGSEGTLAVTTAATLRLVERPRARANLVLAFADVAVACDAIPAILATAPAAIELLDELLIRLAAASPHAPALRRFVAGAPAAVLIAEYWGADQAEVQARVAAAATRLARARLGTVAITQAPEPAQHQAIETIRRIGQPLLMGMAPDRKPQTCVEDSAVAPEQLGGYVRRFRALLEGLGLTASFYGHASVGLLHVRPLLNLHEPHDRRAFVQLSEAVCDLVLEFGGALSGEHGDGLLRSAFNERLFGPELYSAFQRTKALFDPAGLLNPGKITAAPPITADHRPPPRHTIVTAYRFHEVGGFALLAEACNGNALCRKLDGGTMCPSFMVTRDEEHSTRGRANALRAITSGALPLSELTGDRLHAALDLCLECKACTRECPSGVNMTRLKSEVLHQRHQVHGAPLRSRLFAHIRSGLAFASALGPSGAWLAQTANRLGAQRLLGFAAERSLPAPAQPGFMAWWRATPKPQLEPSHGTVVLFPDTWALYVEPQIAVAAVRVLWAAGYEVLVPTRALCCGRPALSKGLLDQAKGMAAAQLDWLAPYAEAGLPIIGLEPSCILSFRDEYPDLINDSRVETLAQRSFTFEEWVAAALAAGRWPQPLAPLPEALIAHNHCHAQALANPTALAACLAPCAETVTILDAGCCGMAGSFGYEREHYDLSLQIGERVLLPAIRAVSSGLAVANGTSCRQQIAHGAQRQALHPAEIWQLALRL